jgi:hypothetical protein
VNIGIDASRGQSHGMSHRILVCIMQPAITPLLNLCSFVFSRTFQSLVTALLTNRINIRTFRMVLTVPLCVLYGSQNKQQLLSCIALTCWFCVTEAESVYCAVCAESVYKSDTFFL